MYIYTHTIERLIYFIYIYKYVCYIERYVIYLYVHIYIYIHVYVYAVGIYMYTNRIIEHNGLRPLKTAQKTINYIACSGMHHPFW